jgi:hypothetical protein
MYTMAMLLCIGPTVNLFIDHSQIVEFTAWKTQLWGDIDIWKDKTLSYKNTLVNYKQTACFTLFTL